MNDDQLEAGIKRAFGRYHVEPQPLCELISANTSVPPTTLLTRRRAFGGLSLAGLGAAILLAATLVLGQAPAGRGPSAWAGWQPVPSKPDQAMRERARSQCFSNTTGIHPDTKIPGSSVTYGEVPLLVQDQRGSVAVFLFGMDSAFVGCEMWRNDHGDFESSIAAITWPDDRSVDDLAIVGWMSFIGPAGQSTDTSTLVGLTKAARVVIIRDDGMSVEATVQDGIFAAWWPGHSQAATAIAYDSSGREIARQVLAPDLWITNPPGQTPQEAPPASPE